MVVFLWSPRDICYTSHIVRASCWKVDRYRVASTSQILLSVFRGKFSWSLVEEWTGCKNEVNKCRRCRCFRRSRQRYVVELFQQRENTVFASTVEIIVV